MTAPLCPGASWPYLCQGCQTWPCAVAMRAGGRCSTPACNGWAEEHSTRCKDCRQQQDEARQEWEEEKRLEWQERDRDYH